MTPSNLKFLNGSVDISRAITVDVSAQNCLREASSTANAAPKHTFSLTNSPLTEPVPKPIVTRSQRSPIGTCEPSRLIGTAEPDAFMLYVLCSLQVSLWHSTEG